MFTPQFISRYVYRFVRQLSCHVDRTGFRELKHVNIDVMAVACDTVTVATLLLPHQFDARRSCFAPRHVGGASFAKPDLAAPTRCNSKLGSAGPASSYSVCTRLSKHMNSVPARAPAARRRRTRPTHRRDVMHVSPQPIRRQQHCGFALFGERSSAQIEREPIATRPIVGAGAEGHFDINSHQVANNGWPARRLPWQTASTLQEPPYVESVQ